jgi:hypothetical protein
MPNGGEDGSFSENFYGLRRAPVTADGKVPPLTSTQKQWSLFFLVVIPYLKDKADRWYSTRYGRVQPGEYNYHTASARYDESAPQVRPIVRFVKEHILTPFCVLFGDTYIRY